MVKAQTMTMNTMTDKPKIAAVYTFANGMCMVFDQHGQQMPEFQGRTDECLPKIRAAGFAGGVTHGTWGGFRNEQDAK
jgi:hypothetical protein